MIPLTDIIQINIPFRMLRHAYGPQFIRHRLNPEIGFDAEILDRCTDADYKAAAKPLLDAGRTVTFHAPFIDLSPGSPDPKIRTLTRQRIEQVIRLIPFFRPVTVVCHAGYDDRRYGFLRDEWLARSVEMWSLLAEKVNAAGASLMLENVYEQSPEEIRPLFDRLRDHKVAFCLDTGHQAVFSRASMDGWVTSLGAYLGQLHLHDNTGHRDDHLALGQGSIDFRKLFQRLGSLTRIPPVVTLEPHTEDALWPSVTYLQEIWPW